MPRPFGLNNNLHAASDPAAQAHGDWPHHPHNELPHLNGAPLDEMERDNRAFRRTVISMIVVFGLVIGLCTLLIVGAHAHMRDRPDLDLWFNQLSSHNGLCCSYVDGAILADQEWTESGDCEHFFAPTQPQSLYCVRIPIAVAINGVERAQYKWVSVPEGVVVNEPNRYGPAMLWPVWGSWVDDVHTMTGIRCFMKGAEG